MMDTSAYKVEGLEFWAYILLTRESAYVMYGHMRVFIYRQGGGNYCPCPLRSSDEKTVAPFSPDM